MRNFLSVAKMASLVYERENCGGEMRDTKTLNLSRNIVSLQVLVDVFRFLTGAINLTCNKNICCGLKKCSVLIG